MPITPLYGITTDDTNTPQAVSESYERLAVVVRDSNSYGIYPRIMWRDPDCPRCGVIATGWFDLDEYGELTYDPIDHLSACVTEREAELFADRWAKMDG